VTVLFLYQNIDFMLLTQGKVYIYPCFLKSYRRILSCITDIFGTFRLRIILSNSTLVL